MTHLLTGFLVVTLLACLYVLPHLMWDVLTMPNLDPED